MVSRDTTPLGYRRIVILLVSLVVVPSSLLLTSGVVLIFLGEARLNLLMGILVMALSGAVVTGVILVWVFVRREANLSQLQSDFVSKVSHELRTPLTSIRLFSDTLALRRSDAEAIDTCIAGLKREGARLQDLIDRLLDWGRMESGRRPFHMEPTEVGSIVQRAIAAFEGVRERQNARLSVSVPEPLPTLWAECASISDALLNLLTNASKYGGHPAEIALRVSKDGGRVRISVQDNGIG